MINCYDCVHSSVKGNGILKCSRKGTDVSDRENICSRFANTDNTHTCDECEYYEFGAFSKWNDHGKCNLTGKKHRDDDVACSSFYPF